MHKRIIIAGLLGVLMLISAVLVVFLGNANIAVLNPKGAIGHDERNLIVISTVLMLLVVLPVFVLTFYISWKYRAGKGSRYEPEWDHGRKIEIAWWAIPGIIITVLALIAWQSSHKLDPFRHLSSNQKPLNIQVVALQWKWLFIYPDQNIASVNSFEMPINRPVNFQITSDAPMNSFWIPQLGGQIYAMSGMATHLSLMANEKGSYDGSSANISGQGFSSMRFNAIAVPDSDFKNWIKSVQGLPNSLSSINYISLARPSEDRIPRYFSAVDPLLFEQVIAKYTDPALSQSPFTIPAHIKGTGSI